MTAPEIPSEAARAEPVRILKLVPGGHGFATLADGRSLIVPRALPGDLVRVTQRVLKGGALQAVDWQLDEPSSDRRAPLCEVATECGGCDLMALTASAQERAKLELLGDALSRVAHLDARQVPTSLIRSGPEFGYRSRLRLQVSEDGRLGFFQKGTHELIQPRRCHVASPAIGQALVGLRKAARQQPEALAAFACVEIRISDDDVSMFFSLRPEHAWLPIQAAGLLKRLGRDYRVATNVDQHEPNYDRLQLTEQTYLLAPPGAFTQVNWAVNRVLVARVLELVLAARISNFIDLYCGVGNFTLPLVAAGLTGVGVEEHRWAAAAAKRAAAAQGLKGGRFVVQDAVAYAETAHQESRQYDLVLIDPPRSGVKAGLAAMAGIARSYVCMVGCDPVTFARDLRGLIDAEFRLEHLEAFDMFPQTHHLETLAWLSRPA